MKLGRQDFKGTRSFVLYSVKIVAFCNTCLTLVLKLVALRHKKVLELCNNSPLQLLIKKSPNRFLALINKRTDRGKNSITFLGRTPPGNTPRLRRSGSLFFNGAGTVNIIAKNPLVAESARSFIT